MRTIIDTTDWKVTAFNASVYKQEKCLINVTIKEEGDYVGDDVRLRVYNNSTTPRTYTTLATYKTDSDGNLTIDASDLVRVGVIDSTITIDAMNGSVVDETTTITWSVAGLIDYDFNTIPVSWAAKDSGVQSGGDYDTLFVPSRIVNGLAMQFVVAGPSRYSFDGVNYTTLGNTTTIAAAANATDIYLDDGYSNIYHFPIAERGCDNRIASVQWVSRHGETKRANWYIKDVTYTTNESTELETMNDAYNILKGQEHSFTLYLDGLTAYDYWYYSDIVTSSDVRVNFISTTPTEDDRVEVVTKKVTIPNGDVDELHKLEVEINFKHYDVL